MENICNDCGRWKKGVIVGDGAIPIFCECIKPTLLEGSVKQIETLPIYRKGIELFGTAEKFRKYLNTFNMFLNCKPIELIKRGYIDVVEKDLNNKCGD